ncbi:FAD-dependent oxidoreductase [Patescibacteria group bacterium]|jgi:NADH dehydrogenase|nr:FAD-dependent oxidoreductase [Patescibacteria group bacterium]
MPKQKVLVVGGGFAGTKAALDLSRDERFDITLLSDKAYLTYYPTLYHVATGGLRSNATIPLNTIFEGSKVKIATGKAKTLDRKTKTILTATNETYSYDILVLALGVITNYFDIPGLAELSYGVKSIEDVEKLKSHIHQQLIDNRQPDLNYVIVGAGPTGIELAGALPEYIKHIMQLHKLQPRPLHIDLIDSSTRLLAHLPRDTSRMVARQIRKKGIKIYTNQRVEGESANNLTINGKLIQSHTVIWTAGASMNPFFADNNFAMSANHHVSTDVYLAAEDSIFVLGDNANTPYSGMAQTALYDGEFLAANLIRQENGKNMKPYRPKQPITIIPVGEGWAAVIAGKIRLYGWLGWVLRQAADARAFHGYESWNKAIPQWFSYSSVEESCPVCLSAERT